MIIFLSTADVIAPLKSLTGPGFGADLPEIRVMSYEEALRAVQLPRATYVFTDLERLSAFELRLAGALCVGLAAAGLRTLNNPAHVKLRYELLRELAERGLNPFNVHRGDDRPRPGRFPVFLRFESGHFVPFTRLLRDQAELEAGLDALRRAGRPGSGVLVVEHCPSDRIEGRWFKWGAFCVAGTAMLDHIAVDDNWMVKTGRWEQLTPGIVELEHRAVLENRHADHVQSVFRIANIDFGRADFALSGGRPLTFEINTNPFIHDLREDPHRLRCATMLQARRNLAAALFGIDTERQGMVDVPVNPGLGYCRKTLPGRMLAPRM